MVGSRGSGKGWETGIGAEQLPASLLVGRPNLLVGKVFEYPLVGHNRNWKYLCQYDVVWRLRILSDWIRRELRLELLWSDLMICTLWD